MHESTCMRQIAKVRRVLEYVMSCVCYLSPCMDGQLFVDFYLPLFSFVVFFSNAKLLLCNSYNVVLF